MSLIQDLRYGVRMIAKTPSFTVLAMLALAIGICANTTIFSLINGLILRPVKGVAEPERLVGVYTSDFSSGIFGGSSYPDYVDFRNQADTLENLAAYESAVQNASNGNDVERLRGFIVTGNYFQVLGVRAQLGRTLQSSDDQPANTPAVVISDDLWRRRFNSDPNVVGQTLRLNDKSYAIAGVTDPIFHGLRLGSSPDFWIPADTKSDFATSERGSRGIQIVGRLKPGVTLAEAQAQFTTIAARLAQAYPETNLGTLGHPNEPRPVTVAAESQVGPQALIPIKRVSLLLFAVVGLVLLIACANVANLLLARASARRREIAVRLALGASRWRLVRQLLTESFLLALLGGVAGLLATQWTARLLPQLFAPNERVGVDLSTDWRVLLFALGITFVTALLFGLMPALQATRLNLISSLKDEAGTFGQRLRRIGLRDALVIAQLAISLVLLIGAALFLRSLQKAFNFDPGFATENLLTATMETEGANLSEQQARALYEQSLERVSALPGVQSATLSFIVPLTGGGYRRFITMEGYQPQPNEDTELNTNIIGPEYFKTMSIPLVAGRDFTTQDREGSPLVVIVNEELARRYYGGNAIGKRLQFGSGEGVASREIVGVARTARYRDLREEPLPFIYVPMGQEYQAGMSLLVRAKSDPEMLIGPLQNEMRALNKEVPLFAVQTMSRQISEHLSGHRMIAVLLSVFGAGALLLASIGIYGVMGYAVAQRTREIGVRIALGAERRDILKLILRQGMVLILIGAGIGLALAFAATQVLKSVLFGVSATDPLTFGSVVFVLVGVALVACYLPARRATKVDPLVALRYE